MEEKTAYFLIGVGIIIFFIYSKLDLIKLLKDNLFIVLILVILGLYALQRRK